MTVNIIAVGKLKENYLREACAEYSKRLGAFCKLNITELAECRVSEKPSENEIKTALLTEGKVTAPLIIGKNCYNIAMCIEGKQLSSTGLSEKIERIAVDGKSILNIIIGSSFGIAEEIKEMSDFKLSMSAMTFPHQLARVMVLEQLYRAFQISNGSKYHK